MKYTSVILPVLLSACIGGPRFTDIVEPGFFDSGSFRDSADSQCVDPLIAAWPANTVEVHPSVGLELQFEPEMDVLDVQWLGEDGRTVPHSVAYDVYDGSTLLRLSPDGQGHKGQTTTWVAAVDWDSPGDPCVNTVFGTLRAADLVSPASLAHGDGKSWWVPLDERNDSSGVLLSHLITQAGPTSGRALGLSLNGDMLSLGSIERTPSLPTDACDATDDLTVTDDDGLVTTASTLLIDDLVRPLTLHDVEFSANIIDDGEALDGLQLQALVDLSGFSEADRNHYCQLAEQLAHPCVPCPDEGAVACFSVHAKGLRAAHLPTGLDAVQDLGACSR